MKYDLFTTLHLSFFFFFCPLCIFFLLNCLTLAAPGFSMVFNVLVRWQSLLSLFRVLFHPHVLRDACFYLCSSQKGAPPSVWATKWGCVCVDVFVWIRVCVSPSFLHCCRQELRYLQPVKNHARWNLTGTA